MMASTWAAFSRTGSPDRGRGQVGGGPAWTPPTVGSAGADRRVLSRFRRRAVGRARRRRTGRPSAARIRRRRVELLGGRRGRQRIHRPGQRARIGRRLEIQFSAVCFVVAVLQIGHQADGCAAGEPTTTASPAATASRAKVVPAGKSADIAGYRQGERQDRARMPRGPAAVRRVCNNETAPASLRSGHGRPVTSAAAAS